MWEVNVRRDNWDWFDSTLGEYKAVSTDHEKEVEYGEKESGFGFIKKVPIKIIHKKYFMLY